MNTCNECKKETCVCSSFIDHGEYESIENTN